MYIHEAIELAMKNSCYMRLREEHLENYYFKPTNGPDCIIVLNINSDNPRPYPMWNPKADDLTSDKWELYKR